MAAGRPRILPGIPPATYARLFCNTPEGEAVLAELARLFGGPAFRPGGQEGERETCFRLGQNDVVNFITAQIEKARNPQE